LDIKATHGYLLSELLGAKTREGRYGGPLENRARMLRNVFRKVRERYGKRLLLGMRLGCFDGVPYRRNPETGIGEPYAYPIPYPWGWGVNPMNPLEEDLSEVKQLLAWLVEDGLELLNVSIGCPYYNPHIGRPFEKPDEGNYEQPEHPLLGVDRHFRVAGELQRALPELPMIGTGYSWLQKYALNAAAANLDSGAIRLFGLGRGVLSYPDFARDALEKGELDEARVCKTLTYCSFLMRQKTNELGQYPTGCPPFDKQVYGPIIKEAREHLRRPR
jgi:2,4-dienoyl-CoA reductase-like NADH-dependent reductase (Old Yellow Enzyme family)